MRNPNYRIGQYPQYDHFVDQYRMSSTILKGINGFSGDIGSYTGCKALMAEYIGNLEDRPGYFYQADGRKYILAILPSLKLELEQVTDRFKNFVQRRVNEGGKQIEDKLENWPKDLLNRRLQLEAILAVRHEELAAITKRITAYERQEEAEKNKLILRHGPKGSFHLNSSGFIMELDGQAVAVVNDIPTITEPSSPYKGMRVCDYFEFIIPAFRAQSKAMEEAQLKQLQDEARRNGWIVPMSVPCNVGKTVPRELLPPWPDGVKPNLPDGEVIKDEIIRTK